MAHVDEVDPLRAAAVVDREQVAAGEREQLAHAVGLQAARDQPAAVQGLGRFGLDVMAPESTPAVRGVCRAGGPGRGPAPASSFRGMDTTPRTDDSPRTSSCCCASPTARTRSCPEIRDADQAPEEEIDARILAGLVSP